MESNLPDLFLTEYEPAPVRNSQSAVWEQGVWYEDMSYLPAVTNDERVIVKENLFKDLDNMTGMDFLL